MNDKPRLIDADALVISINEEAAFQIKKLDDKNSPAHVRGLLMAQRITKNAPTIDASPQWIPVAERLPEIYKDEYGDLIPFLVCLKDTDYPFRAFFDGKTWGDGCFKLSVVAWMPLPEPYKMNGKDGEK